MRPVALVLQSNSIITYFAGQSKSVRFNREFVINVIVLSEFECSLNLPVCKKVWPPLWQYLTYPNITKCIITKPKQAFFSMRNGIGSGGRNLVFNQRLFQLRPWPANRWAKWNKNTWRLDSNFDIDYFLSKVAKEEKSQ